MTSLLLCDITLETQSHSKLKLTRIECRGWLSERWQRIRACTESVIRHSEIRAIKNIEAFGHNLQIHSFTQTEPPAQTQIERSEIKSASGISTNTCRAVVVVSVEVA